MMKYELLNELTIKCNEEITEIDGKPIIPRCGRTGSEKSACKDCMYFKDGDNCCFWEAHSPNEFMPPIIPYCGRRTIGKYACKGCMYFTDGYCDYWEIHSPDDCPYCGGSGWSSDDGRCEECYGTGVKQKK